MSTSQRKPSTSNTGVNVVGPKHHARKRPEDPSLKTLLSREYLHQNEIIPNHDEEIHSSPIEPALLQQEAIKVCALHESAQNSAHLLRFRPRKMNIFARGLAKIRKMQLSLL